MTDQKPNCGDCTNREVNPNDDSFCKVTGEELGGEFEFECTHKYGCLSHPGAREWLMRDVVKELESYCAPGDSVWAHYSPNELIALIKGVE